MIAGYCTRQHGSRDTSLLANAFASTSMLLVKLLHSGSLVLKTAAKKYHCIKPAILKIHLIYLKAHKCEVTSV